MSQAGIVDIEGSHPQIPTEFVTDDGTAIPIGNILEILGTAVAAHSIPLRTTGSGNTVTIEVQYASAAASSVAANAGVSSFDSADFTVDSNGFVTLTAVAASTKMEVDAFTPPGTNPVVPDGAGIITVTGGQVAAGTTTNVIRTNSLAANTYTIQIQRSQAVGSSTIGDNGVSHFNSTYFTVDANGFVSLVASSVASSFTVDAATAPGTNPVVPNGSGNITVTGGQVAAGTTTNVIRTDSLAANTYTIQVQRSQAVASSTIGDNGVSHFNSTYFTVDANGFVSVSGTGIGQTITGQSGGALSPTAGNWNIFGSAVAAGTTPVATSGSGSTLTTNVQRAQAIASTNATNVGLAAFNSTYFTVDGNGFVSINGSTIGQTITGDSGGPLSPTGGNWNILSNPTAGSTVSFSGSVSTLSLNVSDSRQNTIIGFQSGNNTLTGHFSVGLGLACLSQLTSGGSNTAIGYVAGTNLTSGGGNTIVGQGGLNGATTGGFNLILGYASGSAYTSSESSNILLSNGGVLGESNTIHIGTQGSSDEQQNKCFIAGIAGVSVSNQQFVTINSSTGQLGSNVPTFFSQIVIQKFTSSGTYTPTSGMKYCIVECVGGGGGSGGVATAAATNVAVSGGGGGGGYARKVLTAATVGVSQTVTIGAGGIAGTNAPGNGGTGGTTSLGTLCVAAGGSGSVGSAAFVTVFLSIAGGQPGVGTTGDVLIDGSPGNCGVGSGTSNNLCTGQGGGSYFGGGGISANSSGTGAAGNLYGGGASGAGAVNGAAASTGSAGAAGLIVITEYI